MSMSLCVSDTVTCCFIAYILLFIQTMLVAYNSCSQIADFAAVCCSLFHLVQSLSKWGPLGVIAVDP